MPTRMGTSPPAGAPAGTTIFNPISPLVDSADTPAYRICAGRWPSPEAPGVKIKQVQRGPVGRRRQLRAGNLRTVIVVILLETQAGRRHGVNAGPGRGIERKLRQVVAASRVVAV